MVVSGLQSDTVHAPRNLSGALLSRLGQIAELDGGQVPLHGRLFAHWLHHAYPRECSFPHANGASDRICHRNGRTSTTSIRQWRVSKNWLCTCAPTALTARLRKLAGGSSLEHVGRAPHGRGCHVSSGGVWRPGCGGRCGLHRRHRPNSPTSPQDFLASLRAVCSESCVAQESRAP